MWRKSVGLNTHPAQLGFVYSAMGQNASLNSYVWTEIIDWKHYIDHKVLTRNISHQTHEIMDTKAVWFHTNDKQDGYEFDVQKKFF